MISNKEEKVEKLTDENSWEITRGIPGHVNKVLEMRINEKAMSELSNAISLIAGSGKTSMNLPFDLAFTQECLYVYPRREEVNKYLVVLKIPKNCIQVYNIHEDVSAFSIGLDQELYKLFQKKNDLTLTIKRKDKDNFILNYEMGWYMKEVRTRSYARGYLPFLFTTEELEKVERYVAAVEKEKIASIKSGNLNGIFNAMTNINKEPVTEIKFSKTGMKIKDVSTDTKTKVEMKFGKKEFRTIPRSLIGKSIKVDLIESARAFWSRRFKSDEEWIGIAKDDYLLLKRDFVDGEEKISYISIQSAFCYNEEDESEDVEESEKIPWGVDLQIVHSADKKSKLPRSVVQALIEGEEVKARVIFRKIGEDKIVAEYEFNRPYMFRRD